MFFKLVFRLKRVLNLIKSKLPPFQLILMSVLNGLYESVSQILRRGVEKRAVLDNIDSVMLAVNEICDGG